MKPLTPLRAPGRKERSENQGGKELEDCLNVFLRNQGGEHRPTDGCLPKVPKASSLLCVPGVIVRTPRLKGLSVSPIQPDFKAWKAGPWSRVGVLEDILHVCHVQTIFEKLFCLEIED